MSGALQAVFQNQRSFGTAPGQQAYTASGLYSWVAPAGVTSVSVVVVGPGDNVISDGTRGGALAYKNNYTVIPGNSYAVRVYANSTNRCYFVDTATVSAGVGSNRTGDGGGDGGTSNVSGAGAGGYAGSGGNGVAATFGGNPGNDGAGGGGGSGGTSITNNAGSGGGGVGLLGQGSNGAGGAIASGGGGGSGGASGANLSGTSGGAGGAYGGGGGFNDNLTTGGAGAVGAVRIIWPGTTRSFPSTNTGDL